MYLIQIGRRVSRESKLRIIVDWNFSQATILSHLVTNLASYRYLGACLEVHW